MRVAVSKMEMATFLRKSEKKITFLKNTCRNQNKSLSLHQQNKKQVSQLNFYIMTYFVEYNAKYIASYKSLKAAQNFIARKGLKNDEDNVLTIWDNEGNEYEVK